jgi:uncharacterized surface protein with fasciclin (FAS1) repeats
MKIRVALADLFLILNSFFMKKILSIVTASLIILLFACNSNKQSSNENSTSNNESATAGGQENVKDDESQKDIVKIAVGSKDHTTLVTALKQADLVTALSNAGPFTVFAPTNAAFDKLPKGTLDELMKPEKITELQNILQYHVTTSALKTDYFRDGQIVGMVNGDNLTVNVKDGKIILNNSATIIGSVQASNGMVHIIDAVLLPPTKK